MPMIGIIPLMGVGQRFKDAGITTPKHLLEVFPGVTILEKIISTFNGEPVYIGCRPEYYDDIVKIVEAGQYKAFVYSLNYSVLSPIETTLMLLDHIYCDFQPIVVHYCDVFLPDGTDGIGNLYPPAFEHNVKSFQKCDAALIVVETDDDRFTKEPITGNGIGGVYFFKNKSELLRRVKLNPRAETMGEVVMASSYFAYPIPQIDIGTPEAYREYLEKFNEPSKLRS